MSLRVLQAVNALFLHLGGGSVVKLLMYFLHPTLFYNGGGELSPQSLETLATQKNETEVLSNLSFAGQSIEYLEILVCLLP